MLLSDKTTAQLIGKNFVPTWRMVRPVPKVSIDFGNGKKLERTLVGNTVLYFTRPDGRVLDAIPGVCTPAKFAPLAKEAVVRFNKGDKKPGAELIQFDSKKAEINLGKSAVESPILRAGSADLSAEAPRRVEMNASKMSVQSPVLRAGGMSGINSARTIANRNRPLWEAHADQLEDISKQPRSARSVARSIVATSPAQRLEDEAGRNVFVVRPIIREYLASNAWKLRFDQASPTIFKRILHLDIDDPYLGLANFGAPGTPMPKR